MRHGIAGCGGLEALHRQVIDADRPDAGLDDVLRGVFGEVHEVLVERLLPFERSGVGGLAQHGTRAVDAAFEVGAGDGRGHVGQVEHPGRSDHLVERRGLHRPRPLAEVPGRVHVGAGVQRQADARHVAGVALVHARHRLERPQVLSGPLRQPIPQGHRDVDGPSAREVLVNPGHAISVVRACYAVRRITTAMQRVAPAAGRRRGVAHLLRVEDR
jgi:hypothetical protein